MAIGNPFDRDWFVIGGSVKTTGGSANLSKGTLALVDKTVSTLDGSRILATVTGMNKRQKNLVLQLGVADRESTRSHQNGSMKTLPFALEEVKDLRVSAPASTEQKVDELTLGYDGVNPSTAFSFRTGDSTFRATLKITGDALAYRGGGNQDTEYVSVNVDIPDCPTDACIDCDPCDTIDPREIILDVIEQFRRRQITGGATLDKYVDITPIFSCTDDRTATEIPYDYYCLNVCDTGTQEALALVSQQYNTPVIMTERVGSTSTYQMLLPRTAGAPDDYVQSIASLIKGCATCPDGYTATDSGYLYSVSMEDDGTDQKALLADLPGFVTGTNIRELGHLHGAGFYTVILTGILTPAQIATFIAASAIKSTAILTYHGPIASICENGNVTEIAWASCGSCNVIQETYTITLPDNECGEDRLAELNGAYGGNVTIATQAATQALLTLTGTGGTANVTIDGTNYLATFDTSLTITAANFVTAHAADILEAHNIIVTSAAAVITFKAPTADWVLPTIANVTTNLAGSVATATPTTLPFRKACQTKYQISVISNMVCEECDEVFEDFYTTKAPAPYAMTEWVKDANTGSNPSGTCLTGIRFKAKTFVLQAEEPLRDMINFTETSVKLEASAGYPLEIREGIGRINGGAYIGRYLSRWVPRTHLAGNLRDLENASRYYFQGYDKKDYLGRILTGEISNMEDQLKQYVMYTLQIGSGKHAQGFAGRISQDINYHIWVEVGRHTAVEYLLNNIATNAGLDAVKAFGS